MGNAVDERWFKAQLADRGMSIRELGRKMSMDHSALVLTFKGRRQMKFQEAAQMASLLGVGVSQVLEHAGMPVEGARQVPIVGYIDGAGEAHLDWDAQGERTSAPPELPENAVAVQYRTGLSALEHLDGWISFCCPPREGVRPEHLNRMCLVGLRNGVSMIRYLRRGYKKDRYNLESMVGLVSITDADVAWSTPILWMRSAE